MTKWIRQDNVDKPHGFCQRMVKYQSNARTKGIGAYYVFTIIGDGPSADSHHLEIGHVLLRAEQSLKEYCINSGITINVPPEKKSREKDG